MGARVARRARRGAPARDGAGALAVRLRRAARCRRRRSRPLVRRVAERLRLRVATAAERDGRALRQLELAALGVDERDRPDDLVRPVRANRDRDLVHGASVASAACPSPPTIQARGASHLPRDPARVVGAARHERARRRRRATRSARAGTTPSSLAPSSRSADLLAGRRALQAGVLDGVVALVPRRARLAAVDGRRPRRRPRERRRRRSAPGDFDVVHGFDPGVPGLAYVALLEAETTTVATFVDPERLSYPAAAQPARPAPRADRHAPRRRATRRRGPRRGALPGGVHGRPRRRRPRALRTAAKERAGRGRDLGRRAFPSSAQRSARSATTRRLGGCPAADGQARRPAVDPARAPRPRPRAHRAHRRARAPSCSERAAIVVPSPDGLRRLRAEAAAAGCAVVEPPGVAAQPELAAAALLRLAEDDRGARAATPPHDGRRIEAELRRRRRARRAPTTRSARRRRRPAAAPRDRAARRPRLDRRRPPHAHEPLARLLDRARRRSSTTPRTRASARSRSPTTTSSAARSRRSRLARGRDLIVIPGEEVKTDRDGEVIGLFLHEEIPRGMSFADTLAAIREQEGVVYVPHPFDRMHAIPSPATLHRHLPRDRRARGLQRAAAVRRLQRRGAPLRAQVRAPAGAGSDAHVLQGVGTGALRMRRFDGPEEFLLSLRTATVLRRPKSLAYLQSLKWVAQVRERVSG